MSKHSFVAMDRSKTWMGQKSSKNTCRLSVADWGMNERERPWEDRVIFLPQVHFGHIKKTLLEGSFIKFSPKSFSPVNNFSLSACILCIKLGLD